MIKPNLPEPENAKPEVCRPQDYRSYRAFYYDVPTQLDHLYHDIEAGLFGPAAQQGRFFKYLQEIKQAIPKPEDSV